MRVEYRVMQRLLFDAPFRRAFTAERERSLELAFPGAVLDVSLFGDRATIPGLDEEAYRRIATLCRTSKEVFPCAHSLAMAFWGDRFFEDILCEYYAKYLAKQVGLTVLEILEPFDGYIIGPLFSEQITREEESRRWVSALARYEWSVWHAQRVSQGWPALYDSDPLPTGATMVEAAFDLKKLLVAIRRLQGSSVGPETFDWRIHPPPGSYKAMIYPSGDRVLEASLDDETFTALSGIRREEDHATSCSIAREAMQALGLKLDMTFLCCPKADEAGSEVHRAIAELVQPAPH
jgi:hypothetical protein